MRACNLTWAERLSACFDGELTPTEREEVERHVAGCAPCRATLEGFGVLREGLTRVGAREAEVPPALTARLGAELSRSRRTVRRRLLRKVTAAAAAGVLLTGLWAGWPGGLDSALAADVERHHLKAFSRLSPCEFESSNPTEVEAWLEERVGYRVRVPEVPGAVLLGARRCRLAGVMVATILYRHGEDALTLYLPPEDSEVARRALRFVEEGLRCTEGPLGERICVAPGSSRPVLAVSALEAPALAGIVATLHP